MLVDAQGSKSILGGVDGREWIVHSEIPQSNLAIATARDKLPEAPALHVNICDPLLVLAPDLHHRCGGL